MAKRVRTAPPSRTPSPARAPAGPLPWPRDDEHLTPFLPMVYIAWSDGVLTPAEMARIRDEVQTVRGLSPEADLVLASWLDAEAPPSPAALAALKDIIREVAAEVSPEARRSLAALGSAMAQTQDGDSGRWATPRGMRTLQGVEEILGVLGGEAARELAPAAEPPRPAKAQKPFPVERLTWLLEHDRPEIRKKVLALLEESEVRVPDGLPTEEARERALVALKRIAREGLGGVAYPEEVGGKGDVLGSLIVFETLGYGNLSVLIKFGVQFGLFGGSVAQLGTTRHHERYLKRISTLELPGIYGMTERNHGSNVRDIETVARYLPKSDEFEILTPHPGAAKDWLGNAALHGRMATVFAQLEVGGTSHGVHAFLVPVRNDKGRALPGVTIEDRGEKVGLHGVDNGSLSFQSVRIPRENLLNRFGDVTAEGEYRSEIASPGRRFFTMLGTLVAGRISIASASVSAAKTGLVIAIRYCDRRRQFGPSGGPEVPVLDYLSHQRLLLPALATTYALHFATRDLYRAYVAAEDESAKQRVELLAAGLKAMASRHAVDTLQGCREALGGRGYLAANRLGWLREDTDVFTTFEGANAVLLQLVAKGLLTEYRNELGDLRLWGIVRHLGELAGAEAERLNPVRSRRTGEEFLRDPETQLEAFRFRESRLRETAARRLKSRIDAGVDSFRALNECQDHLMTLAQAHVERVVLESFRGAVGKVGKGADGKIGEALGLVADLFALSVMEKHRAWYLETGYMEGTQSKAIRRLVNGLLGEVRPLAVSLVNGFGIPEGILGAPDAVA